MNYWLVKSDPETYGWNELMKDKKTDWTGCAQLCRPPAPARDEEGRPSLSFTTVVSSQPWWV